MIESSCAGITYQPGVGMWLLKTSSTKVTNVGSPNDPPHLTTSGHISYAKECVEAKKSDGSGG